MNRQLIQVLVRGAAVLSLLPIVAKVAELLGYPAIFLHKFDDSDMTWSLFAIGLWLWSELSWHRDRKADRERK